MGGEKKYYTSENIKMLKFNTKGSQTKNYAKERRQDLQNIDSYDMEYSNTS